MFELAPSIDGIRFRDVRDKEGNITNQWAFDIHPQGFPDKVFEVRAQIEDLKKVFEVKES